MFKWQCEVCGNVYDPIVERLREKRGFKAAFEDLPQDWICPSCGADKSQFTPLERAINPN